MCPASPAADAPRVSVSLGRSLDASNIKEGDDLYFECSAISKPPPHKVTWSHNVSSTTSPQLYTISCQYN